MAKRKKIPSSTLYHLRYGFGMAQRACADTLSVSYYAVHRKLNLHRAKTGKCVDCGIPIHKQSTRCRGCSSVQHGNRVKGENNPRWKGCGPRIVVCERCGRSFESYAVEGQYRKFCSRECSAESRRCPRYTLTCQTCKSEFIDPNPEKKYCSRECLDKRNPPVEQVCAVCNEIFLVKACLVDVYLHCSFVCAMRSREGSRVERVLNVCERCGNEFLVLPSQLHFKYCSTECRSEWRSEYASSRVGPLSPTWRGGISREPYDPDFNDELKTEIRTRDKHKCAICGLEAKNVHHIDYDKKNSSRHNLITLCTPCHMTTNGNRDYWQAELTKLLEARSLSLPLHLEVENDQTNLLRQRQGHDLRPQVKNIPAQAL